MNNSKKSFGITSENLAITQMIVPLRSGSHTEYDEFTRIVKSTLIDLKKTTSSPAGSVDLKILVVGKIYACVEQTPVKQPPLTEPSSKDLAELCIGEQENQSQINQASTRRAVESGRSIAEKISTEGLNAEQYRHALASSVNAAVSGHVVGTSMRDPYVVKIGDDEIHLGGLAHVPRELAGASRKVEFRVAPYAKERSGVVTFHCLAQNEDSIGQRGMPLEFDLNLPVNSAENQALALASLLRLRIVGMVSYTLSTQTQKSTFLLESIDNKDELIDSVKQLQQNLLSWAMRSQFERPLL